MTRGKKRYELSDHLGNVHTVLSDRKKTECVSNVFSAYEPEIINMYDYYPFGMLMEERKGQKPECATSTSAVTKIAYTYAFPLNVEGFTAVGDANNSVSNVGAALRAARGGRTYATSWGAARSGHYMVKGVPYTLSWKMMGLTFGGTQPAGSVSTVGKTIQVRIKTSGGSIVSTTNVTLTAAMVSGSVSFTPATTDNYILEFIYADVSCTNAAFDIDDVQISYASQETTVDCNAPSCVQVAYQHTFTGSTESFTALSNTTLNATGDRLNVVNTVTAAIGWGAYRTGYNLTGGVTYAIRFDYNTGTTGAGTGLAVQLRNSVSTIVFNQTVTGTGTYTLYFTPSATGTYRLDFRVASSVMGTLTLDNVRIGTELPGSLCNIQSGYLYGFNGQMKDDEVYGVEGTSYTAEYWQYDSRLGRRWNVDPVIKPERSPYDVFDNNPILRIDYRGDNDYVYDEKGNLVTEIKTGNPDRHFMLHEKGDYILKQEDESKPLIRVLSRESITQDPREIERGNTTGFNGILNESYTSMKQVETIASAVSTVSSYLDVVNESNRGTLDFHSLFSRKGELINMDGVYMNNHEALNYLWGKSMAEVNKQGLTEYGVTVFDALAGASLYNLYDHIFNQSPSENQKNHEEAIIRGYLYQTFGKEGAEGLSIDDWVQWKQDEWDNEW